MSRPKPPHWVNDVPGLTSRQAYDVRQGADVRLSTLTKWSHHCRIVIDGGVVVTEKPEDGGPLEVSELLTLTRDDGSVVGHAAVKGITRRVIHGAHLAPEIDLQFVVKPEAGGEGS